MAYAISGTRNGKTTITSRHLAGSAAVAAMNLIEAGCADVAITEAGVSLTLEDFRRKHWGLEPFTKRLKAW